MQQVKITEREKLQEEIAAKKAEGQSTSEGMAGVEKERDLLEDNLKDLRKEKEAKEREEARYAEEMKFLQKQLDSVKLRFLA